MILAHYTHPLPASYDTARIRERAQQRGPLWDDAPELYFKAFLLRERGRFGAQASSYASLYLWQQDRALRDFLVNGRYQTVIDSFGRAEIHTRLALDARKGPGRAARFAYLETLDIPPDADLNATLHAEIARNADAAGQPGTVAAVIGLDMRSWALTRIVLTERAPSADTPGMSHEILHLALPLLETLP
ncbi:MAG: DUF4865 family protein [bacterium]|jgi:hypothetical protein|uniref:DUF4865 family protein n=1 Tax=Ralstonia sp. TaxID=54061 RepID=UPI003978756C